MSNRIIEERNRGIMEKSKCSWHAYHFCKWARSCAMSEGSAHQWNHSVGKTITVSEMVIELHSECSGQCQLQSSAPALIGPLAIFMPAHVTVSNYIYAFFQVNHTARGSGPTFRPEIHRASILCLSIVWGTCWTWYAVDKSMWQPNKIARPVKVRRCWLEFVIDCEKWCRQCGVNEWALIIASGLLLMDYFTSRLLATHMYPCNPG